MPSFVIQTDHVKVETLEPDAKPRTASTRLFWSSQGFAFPEPGHYEVEVRIIWTYDGVPFGVRRSIAVWVNYPQTTVDNEAAASLLHPEVGMYVALGGGAAHLAEAVTRLERVAALGGEGDQPAPKVRRAYVDLLPTKPARVSRNRTQPSGRARRGAGRKGSR